LRLSFYKRLAACEDEEALKSLLDEMSDRYGPAPPQTAALAQAQRVRLAARRAGVTAVTRRHGRWRLRLDTATLPSERLADVLTGWPGAKVSPAGEISFPTDAAGSDPAEVLRFLEPLGEQ